LIYGRLQIWSISLGHALREASEILGLPKNGPENLSVRFIYRKNRDIVIFSVRAVLYCFIASPYIAARLFFF